MWEWFLAQSFGKKAFIVLVGWLLFEVFLIATGNRPVTEEGEDGYEEENTAASWMLVPVMLVIWGCTNMIGRIGKIFTGKDYDNGDVL